MKALFAYLNIFPFAWKTLKKNFAVFIIASLIFCVILGIENGFLIALTKIFGNSSNVSIRFFYHVSYIIVYTFFTYGVTALSIGTYHAALNARDSGKADLKDIFSHFTKFRMILKVFAADVIYLMLIAVGLSLLIIPGLFYATMYSQYRYCIIDLKMGIFKALSTSQAMTRPAGIKTQLMVFYLAVLIINIIGVLICGIGVLITFPLSWISFAYVFRFFSPKVNNPDLATSEVPSP